MSFYREEIRVDKETEWLHRQTDRRATQRKRHVRTWQEDGGTLGETQPADTLVFGLQLPELLKIKESSVVEA